MVPLDSSEGKSRGTLGKDVGLGLTDETIREITPVQNNILSKMGHKRGVVCVCVCSGGLMAMLALASYVVWPDVLLYKYVPGQTRAHVNLLYVFEALRVIGSSPNARQGSDEQISEESKNDTGRGRTWPGKCIVGLPQLCQAHLRGRGRCTPRRRCEFCKIEKLFVDFTASEVCLVSGAELDSKTHSSFHQIAHE